MKYTVVSYTVEIQKINQGNQFNKENSLNLLPRKFLDKCKNEHVQKSVCGYCHKL